MHAELLVLRLVHILSAILWVGSGLFTSFFLVPVLTASPAAMGQVVAGLTRRKLFLVLQIAAALTILSGLRLLAIDSAGFSGSYFATRTGRTFAVSGLFAIIAAVLSFGVSRPAIVRAGAIAASLAASTDPAEKARLTQQADRLRRRGTITATLSLGFGILAASGMAIARYV
jgi:uncharacterized membrane protein